MDVVVIGAGPAGLAAAAHLAETGLVVVLLEHNLPGGQLYEEGSLVDHTGASSTGDDLATELQEAVGDAGVEFQFGSATALELGDDDVRVRSSVGAIACRAVVVATGADRAPITTGSGPVPEHLTTHCLPCDGPLLAGKRIAILGTAAPLARDLALCLAVSPATTVVGPDAARAAGDAAAVEGTVVDVSGAPGALAITVRRPDGSEHVLAADAIVAAQGYLPSATWLPGELLDSEGWVASLTGPRVWATGACRGELRHAGPAAVVADAHAVAGHLVAHLHAAGAG